MAVRGKVSALLALETAFDGEMTAREAALINGVVLGLSVAEARARTEAVLAFAELEGQGSNLLRRFSSGMRARLSFAIGALSEPDVLLVDEVLAVGDEAFQRKCHDRIRALRERGTAVVFVSHDMRQIRELCTRVLWLAGGRIAGEGEPEQVVAAYLASLAPRLARQSGA